MINKTEVYEHLKASRMDHFFIDRAINMISHVCTSNAAPISAVNIRVARDWPARGSITFTRDVDGQRFRAYMTKRKFRVAPVTRGK